MNDIEVYMVVTRPLALALIFSFGTSSMSFAADTLLDSANRAADKLARTERPEPVRPPVRQNAPALAAQQAPRGLESSGLRTRSKILIGLGVAAGFVGIALAIDSRVEDVTPSTKGERTTKPF